jgi:hypothetical protein
MRLSIKVVARAAWLANGPQANKVACICLRRLAEIPDDMILSLLHKHYNGWRNKRINLEVIPIFVVEGIIPEIETDPTGAATLPTVFQ